MKGTILFIATIIFFSTEIFAQQISSSSINSTGASFQSTNGGISLTVGELIVETLGNDSIFMGQGFNNSFLTITLINETNTFLNDIKVFPNPTAKIIAIQITLPDILDITADLFDLLGRKVMTQSNNRENFFMLDLTPFPDGSYFLKLTKTINNEVFKTYKIQKETN